MFKKWISKWATDESGATLVEYGIAILVAVIVGSVGLVSLANQINGNLNSAANELAVEEEE